MPAGFGDWDNRMNGGRGMLEEKTYVNQWRWRKRGEEDHNSWSSTELRVKCGEGEGRGGRGRRGEDLQLVYLLSCPDLLICSSLLSEPQYFCGGVLSFCPVNVTVAALLQPSLLYQMVFLCALTDSLTVRQKPV